MNKCRDAGVRECGGGRLSEGDKDDIIHNKGE